MAGEKKQNPEDILKKLRKIEENKKCVNCGEEAKLGHTNVCLPYGSFVCHNCKSAHQSFSHRIKSITMSTWTLKEAKSLMEKNGGGNVNCAKKWLGKGDVEKYRPKPGDSLEKFKNFVRLAYEEKMFYSGPAPKKDEDDEEAEEEGAEEEGAAEEGAEETPAATSPKPAAVAPTEVIAAAPAGDDDFLGGGEFGEEPEPVKKVVKKVVSKKAADESPKPAEEKPAVKKVVKKVASKKEEAAAPAPAAAAGSSASMDLDKLLSPAAPAASPVAQATSPVPAAGAQGQQQMPGMMPGMMPGQMPMQGQMPGMMPGQMPMQGQMPGQMPMQGGYGYGYGYPQMYNPMAYYQMAYQMQMQQMQQQQGGGGGAGSGAGNGQK